MTKGTAETYWAATALAHFETMSSRYQPGERVESEPAPKRVRRGLPPLTASQTIVDAIAACAQPREGSTSTPMVRAVGQAPAIATALQALAD